MYGIETEGKTEDEVEAMLDEATKQANAYNFIHDKIKFPDGY